MEAELQEHIHHVVVTSGTATVGSGPSTAAAPAAVVALPWATAELAELVGSRVGTTAAVADAGSHCTHLLYAASSAIRFAGSDAASRRYDLTVTTGMPRSPPAPPGDDGLELVLRSDGRTFLDPPLYRGRSLGAGSAAGRPRRSTPTGPSLRCSSDGRSGCA